LRVGGKAIGLSVYPKASFAGLLFCVLNNVAKVKDMLSPEHHKESKAELHMFFLVSTLHQ
jgi:hypothetical protein